MHAHASSGCHATNQLFVLNSSKALAKTCHACFTNRGASAMQGAAHVPAAKHWIQLNIGFKTSLNDHVQVRLLLHMVLHLQQC